MSKKELLTKDDLSEFYVFDDELSLKIKEFVDENNLRSSGANSNSKIYINRGEEESKKVSIYVSQITVNEFTGRKKFSKKRFVKSVMLKNLIPHLIKTIDTLGDVPQIQYKLGLTVKFGVYFDRKRLITFGLYKGANVDHLEILDPSYFEWLKRAVVKEFVTDGYIGSEEFTKYVYDTYCEGVEGFEQIKKESFLSKKMAILEKFCEENDVPKEDVVRMKEAVLSQFG